MLQMAFKELKFIYLFNSIYIIKESCCFIEYTLNRATCNNTGDFK